MDGRDNMDWKDYVKAYREKAGQKEYKELESKADELRNSFIEKFGIEALESMSGVDLLRKMFYSDLHDNNSMCYLLETDRDYYQIFGSVKGGSAYKFELFYNNKMRSWASGSPQKPKILTPDEEKKKEISDYDNAIYYNDYVLKNIFDKVRNTNSVVVFIADHGEEIFDYRDKAHRPPMNPEMKTQYLQCRHEIPAFVWCSDVYKMQNQRLYEGLQSSILKSGSSDLFGHLLLRLSNITSKYYNKENDISSSSYKERPRIVFYKSDNMATDSTGFLIYEKIIK